MNTVTLSNNQSISVVVPLYNEVESVPDLYSELTEVMRGLGYKYELIFIDDGSDDGTDQRLIELAGTDPSFRLVQLRRNFGQTAAMAAGLEYAEMDIVVTMDGDLQNDPRELPKMLDKLSEGYELVAGWRRDRQDKFVSRILPSKIANWIISKTTRVSLHDYGCTLKVMTKDVAKGIKLYGEMHRFIPALADELGARIAEVPVNHRSRKFGQTKYGISRTIRVILDLLTVKFLLGYSKRPIHFFGTVGMLIGMLGTALLGFMVVQKFFFGIPMGSRPLLSLSIMSIIISFQFIAFGLLAEVLARTYYESQEKKIFTVRNFIQGGSLKQSTVIG